MSRIKRLKVQYEMYLFKDFPNNELENDGKKNVIVRKFSNVLLNVYNTFSPTLSRHHKTLLSLYHLFSVNHIAHIDTHSHICTYCNHIYIYPTAFYFEIQ